VLAKNHSLKCPDQLWEKLGCKVRLHEAMERFLSAKGGQVSGISDRRQYPRYFFRKKAFMQHEGQWFAVYAHDLSHSSVGFLHAAQLFPCENVSLCFFDGTKVDLTIRRCRRLQQSCYSCGGQIDTKNRLTIQTMRKLIQSPVSETYP
jgi:hypothetical protein